MAGYGGTDRSLHEKAVSGEAFDLGRTLSIYRTFRNLQSMIGLPPKRRTYQHDLQTVIGRRRCLERDQLREFDLRFEQSKATFALVARFRRRVPLPF